MIKRVWNSYSRYLKISNKESKYAISFGILGAFLETFSIYLLANLITNLSTTNSKIPFVMFNKMNLDIKYHILYFLLSAILSASLYYFSNKTDIQKFKTQLFFPFFLKNFLYLTF